MAFIRLNGVGVTGYTEYSMFGVPTYGDFLPPNIDVEVQARTYTIFIEVDEGFTISKVTYNGDFGIPTDATVSEDGLSSQFTRSVTDAVKLVIDVETEQSGAPSFVSGFNHIYLVDREILKSISRERFSVIGGTDGGMVDLGQYIINILELPFIIDGEIVGDLEPIVLGFQELQTETTELNNDELIIDFGEIEVPYKFNNSYDFINTEIILHVPYAETISLDINYVVNQTIRVEYIVDLYSGNTTINIYSSLIDKIFHSENVKIGRDIPFINSYDKTSRGSISDNSSLQNGLLKPFVEVIRNIPYEISNSFNQEIIKQTTLSTIKGFATVNDITLESSATVDEKQKITNILRNGVYIK